MAYKLIEAAQARWRADLDDRVAFDGIHGRAKSNGINANPREF
jgi:hypothetical protein